MAVTITIPDFEFNKQEFINEILTCNSVIAVFGTCEGCHFGLMKWNLFQESSNPEGVAVLTQLPPSFANHKDLKIITKERLAKVANKPIDEIESEEYFIPIPLLCSRPDLIEFDKQTIESQLEGAKYVFWRNILTQYAPKTTYNIQ